MCNVEQIKHVSMKNKLKEDMKKIVKTLNNVMEFSSVKPFTKVTKICRYAENSLYFLSGCKTK